jgi:virulence-associated protein VagC
MANTKLFKNGNSQAVRIPSELAYSRWDIELVIERQASVRPVGAWAMCWAPWRSSPPTS